MKVLWHQSGVNKQGEPFVQLLADDQVVCQLSPAEARGKKGPPSDSSEFVRTAKHEKPSGDKPPNAT